MASIIPQRLLLPNGYKSEKGPGEREFELFLRSAKEFKISKTRFAEGLGKQTATPDNRLFVSLVAQLNGRLSSFS